MRPKIRLSKVFTRISFLNVMLSYTFLSFSMCFLVALDHCRTEYVFSLFLGSRYMLFWIAVSIVRIIVVFMLNPIDLGRYISFRLWIVEAFKLARVNEL